MRGRESGRDGVMLEGGRVRGREMVGEEIRSDAVYIVIINYAH